MIKGFNAEDQEIKTFEDGVERLFLNVKKSLTSTSLVTSSATFLLGLASAGIMGIGGYMIIENEMTFGDFLAFTLYLGFMIAPIVQMSNIGSQLTEAFAGLDRTEELLSLDPEDDSSVRVNKIGTIKGDVLFKDVSFEYEAGKPVLNNISFSAPAGSVTALVGTSGSGKTTIAGLAATFLNPLSGLITVDGIDLSTVSLAVIEVNWVLCCRMTFSLKGRSARIYFSHARTPQNRRCWQLQKLLMYLNLPTDSKRGSTH